MTRASSHLFWLIAVVIAPISVPAIRAQAGNPQSFRISRDIITLAADRWEGRLTCTRGNDSAAAFIAARFDSLHLQALPGAATSKARNSMYYDPFATRTAAPGAYVPASCQSQNIVGVVRGTDSTLSNEYVVIGAHYDHLGRDTRGSRDPAAGSSIRNGADDNASGTAAMLEVARLFSTSPLKRSFIFVAFSAEEWGSFGSQHFVKQRLASSRVVAMVNLDMIGHLRRDSVIVDGMGSAVEFRRILDEANAGVDLIFATDPSLAGRSDHTSFYVAGIPAVHFSTGEFPDYHTTTDDASSVNYVGVARVADLAARVARIIAERADALTFVPAPVRR